MEAIHVQPGITTVPRQHRNRPNPRAPDTVDSESVSDAIYLIGDHPFLRDQLSACSSLAGKQVISFRYAIDFLEFTGNDAAACVIIDSNMPDMCGLEFQHRLASTSNPSVIFIADQCDVPMTVCAMKAGAIDFFNKPCDLFQLISAIQTGLERDRRVRQRQCELAKLQGRLHLLTPREREVFPLVISGLLNKQAAGILGISEVTLQIHRSQVMRKMEAHSLAELVRLAIKLRIAYWREQPSIVSRTQ